VGGASICTCLSVWFGMVYVNLYSAIVANVSNALCTLVPGKQPGFQVLFEGAKVLLCGRNQDFLCSGAFHSCQKLTDF